MRPARTLLLFAVIALAALAMTSTSAFAQHEVEVTDEATGLHCGDVPCEIEIHSTKTAYIVVHWITGIETIFTETACDQEFNATIDTAGGSGSIHGQVFAGGSCEFKPCGATSQASADGDPWPIALHESESGTHEFGLDLELCIVSVFGSGSGVSCHIEVPVNSSETSHQYELEADGAGSLDGLTCTNIPPGGGMTSIEYFGHWLTEDTNIEIQHAID